MVKDSGKIRSRLVLLFLAGLMALLTFSTRPWSWVLSLGFPDRAKLIYDMGTFPELVGEHLLLVALSGGLSTLIGVAMGVAVTRGWGREFLSTVDSISSIGQTFPPVAVLAVSVPLVGFGFKPTIIALVLYGLLPIVRNTIAGIEAVESHTLEAARGMGMTPLQLLTRIELPLAGPVILAGIRTSTVINIGTATLGATIGAGGLGKPIVAGLIGDNPAYILQGAILVALLALIVDMLMGMVAEGEKKFS